MSPVFQLQSVQHVILQRMKIRTGKDRFTVKDKLQPGNVLRSLGQDLHTERHCTPKDCVVPQLARETDPRRILPLVQKSQDPGCEVQALGDGFTVTSNARLYMGPQGRIDDFHQMIIFTKGTHVGDSRHHKGVEPRARVIQRRSVRLSGIRPSPSLRVPRLEYPLHRGLQ